MASRDEISLESALAWVYARDKGFVRFVEKARDYRPVEEAFLEYSASASVQHEPVCENWAEAWRLLRDQIVAQTLEVRGVSSNSKGEIQYRILEGARVLVPPKTIPAVFLPSVSLDSHGAWPALHFLGNRDHEAAYWRHVEFDSGAIFGAFPEVSLKRKRGKKPYKTFNMNSVPAKKIAMARDAIWPDGKILSKPRERDDKILGWLKKHEVSLDGVSKSNLDRFFDPRNTEKPDES